MILIIFTVNPCEFAYFFKSGDSHEGRQRLLVCLLSPGGVPIEQFVTNWWWALAV